MKEMMEMVGRWVEVGIKDARKVQVGETNF